MSVLDNLFNLEKTDGCSITQIITRHCNLRCSHCNIHEWLDNKTENFYELSQMDQFIDNLKSTGKKKFFFQLIGGEVLSQFDRLSHFINKFKKYHMSMTTNLVNLPDSYDVLKNCQIFVSIDGLPEDHDKQRGIGTFKKTYKNIDKMIKDGHRIRVQCSLNKSYFENKEKLHKFLILLKYVGIKKEDINIGYVVPENPNSCNLHIKQLSNNTPYPIPCCSYRYMCHFVVNPDGRLWSGYYSVGKDELCLGHISDPIDDIRQKYKEQILNSHFAKDEECIKCPALKHCWGLYCLNAFKYNDIKPSSICDKENIIKKSIEIDTKEYHEKIKNPQIKQIYGLINDLE